MPRYIEGVEEGGGEGVVGGGGYAEGGGAR